MDYLIPPWKHQLVSIEKAKDLQWFYFMFEMGAGKTGAAINSARYKIADKQRFLRTLIFAPPLVVPNWKDEWAKHSKVDPRRVVLLEDSGAKRLKTFKQVGWDQATVSPRPVIFVTNYESLRMKELFMEFLAWEPELLIFDEAHLLKSSTSQRSQLAEKLANPKVKNNQGKLTVDYAKKPITYLLSGTPTPNDPTDIFQQFLIMDGGKTFGKNFWIFRSQYFVDRNAGMPKDRYFPDWQIRPGAVDEMNKLIFKHAMRVTKAECLDLPEEVSVTIKCKMAGQQARNYKEMKQDYITFVGENSASAELAITKGLRLMQITSGFLPLNPQGLEDDVPQVSYPATDKDEKLRELLEAIAPSSKVLVWAVWRENYARIQKICDELKLPTVQVHGSIDPSKQKEAIERFKEDPSVRVWIGNPRSGGIGINLTCAPYSIFYSRNFSLVDWLQARSRNHRGGQTEKVTHYDLICEETIDEIVQTKLASKQEMSDKLLQHRENEKVMRDIYLEVAKQSN